MLNEAISTTHEVAAIIIVRIVEVSRDVNELVRLCIKDHDDLDLVWSDTKPPLAISSADPGDVDMIKSGISRTILQCMSQPVPNISRASVLSSNLMDSYCIGVQFNTVETMLVNNIVGKIMLHLYNRMDALVGYSNYVKVKGYEYADAEYDMFLIYKLDLCKLFTAEYRAVKRKSGGPL